MLELGEPQGVLVETVESLTGVPERTSLGRSHAAPGLRRPAVMFSRTPPFTLIWNIGFAEVRNAA